MEGVQSAAPGFAGNASGLAGPLIYCIGIVTAMGTAFYMFRNYDMTFTCEYRGGHDHGHGATPKESAIRCSQ